MRMLHETKSRFVHAFLPHGAWVHTAAEGLLVLSLPRLEASPSGIGWSNIYARCARCGVAETRPSGLW
jgi:hypothetical protein